MKKLFFAMLSVLLCVSMLLCFTSCDMFTGKKGGDEEASEKEDETEEDQGPSSEELINDAIQAAIDGEYFYKADALQIAMPEDAKTYCESASGISFTDFINEVIADANVPENAKIDWEITEQANATEDDITELTGKIEQYGMSADKIGDVQTVTIHMHATADDFDQENDLDTYVFQYDGTYYVCGFIEDIASYHVAY